MNLRRYFLICLGLRDCSPAEANYIQTATSLQVSAEANVEKLTYDANRLEI